MRRGDVLAKPEMLKVRPRNKTLSYDMANFRHRQ